MPIQNFLEKYRRVMRLKHLSYRTEETYLLTIRRFIEFHGGRTHPKDMGAAEIRAYLSHLAIEGNVAASTQNVAFRALLFLYRDVLHLELPASEHVERARGPSRLPEVFTREEARVVLSHMEGTPTWGERRPPQPSSPLPPNPSLHSPPSPFASLVSSLESNLPRRSAAGDAAWAGRSQRRQRRRQGASSARAWTKRAQRCDRGGGKPTIGVT